MPQNQNIQSNRDTLYEIDFDWKIRTLQKPFLYEWKKLFNQNMIKRVQQIFVKNRKYVKTKKPIKYSFKESLSIPLEPV